MIFSIFFPRAKTTQRFVNASGKIFAGYNPITLRILSNNMKMIFSRDKLEILNKRKIYLIC